MWACLLIGDFKQSEYLPWFTQHEINFCTASLKKTQLMFLFDASIYCNSLKLTYCNIWLLYQMWYKCMWLPTIYNALTNKDEVAFHLA